MALTVLIHLHNEDPVVGEIEALPPPEATTILVTNPRQRDGKDLRVLAPGVVSVIWPISRVTFIELLPSEDEEKIISFVRE
jgi:hypothetical protein